MSGQGQSLKVFEVGREWMDGEANRVCILLNPVSDFNMEAYPVRTHRHRNLVPM